MTLDQYILEAIDSSGYELEAITGKEKLEFLVSTFKSEYGYPENIKRYGGLQKTFESYLQGLPSSFNIDFEYSEIINRGMEMGMISTESTQSEQRAFCNQWWPRIFMGVRKLCRQAKVDFDI